MYQCCMFRFSGLVNQAEARDSVLGKVADNEVLQQKEYNPAFVLI